MKQPSKAEAELIRAAMSLLGRRNKGRTSPAKAATAKANGAKGGRPRKNPVDPPRSE